jgi:N-acetylmuramoyl-L-alanine amidase
MPGIWHEVKDQDCISSIAASYGHFWETVWEDDHNAELKELRKDPNVLLRGDRVLIPDLRPREETCATDQHHTFVRRGVPAFLRLFLKSGSEPRRNLRYVLLVDGSSHEGTTNEEGCICVPIPPEARDGLLTVFEDQTRQSYVLRLGAMDPVTELSGAAKRLRNLGFFIESESEEGLAPAVREFQVQQNLEVTGRLDASTREALEREHGI